MLIIRDAQLAALHASRRVDALDELRDQVMRARRQHFPDEAVATGERRVAAAIDACARLGLHHADAVTRWGALIERWGEAFATDPALPWAGRITRWPATAGAELLCALERASDRAAAKAAEGTGGA